MRGVEKWTADLLRSCGYLKRRQRAVLLVKLALFHCYTCAATADCSRDYQFS
jgi:hypothetical protein